MGSYLARRITGSLLTLIGVLALLFVLFHVVGGDPVYQILGNHADARRVAELRTEYGLDRPLLEQFARELRDFVTFDFGYSYATRQPIGDMIASGVGPSLSIAIPAFFLTTLFSLIVGLMAARLRGAWMDRALVLVSVLGMSVPVLALILLGQYFLAFRLGWFPISGFETVWPDRLAYVILPALIWATVSTGANVRYYRTVFVSEFNQDYVRTARAKGVPEWKILFGHVLKNGMIGVLANLATELPLLLLGSFLLESFFGIPGLGGITVEALKSSDFPVLRAVSLTIAAAFIVVNLAVDLAYAAVDPRVRLK